MFLSFIVPVYNTEQYLDECLSSLLNQDIPADDYEIICVNDGSTDGSLKILQSYAQRHQNIRVIDKVNEGVSVARNMGLDTARGKYVWMVDSDDFIAANILSELSAVVAKSEPAIVDFGAYTFNESMSESEKTAYEQNALPATSFANHVYITKSLFLREFLGKHKIRFDSEIAYSEDSLFKASCLIQSPALIKIEKALYFVRFRKGSAITQTSDSSMKRKLESWYSASKQFRIFYQNCDIGLKPIMADLFMANLWSVLSALSHLDYKKAKPYLDEMKADNMFPALRPKECSLRKSYSTDRTDIIGKIFDKLYINLHTVWGFYGMRFWNRLYQTYCRIRGK